MPEVLVFKRNQKAPEDDVLHSSLESQKGGSQDPDNDDTRVW